MKIPITITIIPRLDSRKFILFLETVLRSKFQERPQKSPLVIQVPRKDTLPKEKRSSWYCF